MDIKLYIDGSCNIKEQVGGFGFIITNDKDINNERYGACSEFNKPVNSDRTELEALYQGLKFISRKYKRSSCHIYCDNQMVYDCVIGNSSRNGNRDMWELIEKEFKKSQVDFDITKLTAHTGDCDKDSILNARADKLAKAGRKSLIAKPGRIYNGKKII